ncbi:hypothetical protein [Devosia ginsengisoli]|uniref:hypothetical protein n=1 Tax=Devosia ginsengisoli TaxID=400770 RepID=UPI0026F34093|nr:hypothetical protein [Devosia ginsengisoli]MCR6672345.1 hypothetical protein [Devosia ginsengisoli]
MTNRLRGIALAATISLALVPAALAQDAMTPAPDAMAPAAGAMMAGEPTLPPISDEDYTLCMKQAGGITFPAAMQAAAAACHGLHMGMDVMGAMQAMGVGTNAMGSDAMATDAMAPATK